LKLVKSIIDEYISLVNAGTPIKLDSAINEEASANFYEILEDRNTPDTDESLINESLKKIMDKIIDTLSDEQKLIIRKSFSSTPETLVSIADTL
jgi:DNA-directed RNA polymerase sigma subunit (sigma70/sigma32)